MRFVIVCSLAALIPGPAFGQGLESASATLGSAGGVTYHASFVFRPQPFDTPQALGSPYSAEQVSDEVSPDGARNRQSQVRRKLYRDSQGRTRSEYALSLGPNVMEAPTVVEIEDTPAGYRYILDLQKKIAHRYIPPQPGTETSDPVQKVIEVPVATAGDTPAPALTTQASTPDENPAPKIVIATLGTGEAPQGEKIGTRIIDGLTVEGTRYTQVLPTSTGSPKIATSEIWTSPELRVDVLSNITDFQGGERTVRLTKLSRGEPDPALFRVPPDYTIQNEKGEFRVDFAIGK